MNETVIFFPFSSWHFFFAQIDNNNISEPYDALTLSKKAEKPILLS